MLRTGKIRKFKTGRNPLARFNLEAEAIHIFREVAAEAENPVFLYSVGKDSAVMLHLARKAFYPAKPPFKFLHVDTKWKFKEMIAFRDKMLESIGYQFGVMFDRIKQLEENSNLPNDIISRIVFKIPFIGRIVKFLIK